MTKLLIFGIIVFCISFSGCSLSGFNMNINEATTDKNVDVKVEDDK